MKNKIEEYTEWAEIKYCYETVKKQKSYIDRFVKVTNIRSVEKIKIEDIVCFQRYLSNDGLKNNTIFNYTSAIKSFLKYFANKGEIKFKTDIIPIPKFFNESWKVAKENDIEKMKHYINNKNDFIKYRNKLIIEILEKTGIRNSELCRLKFEDCDFFNNEARIKNSKNNENRLIFWDQKTKSLFKNYLLEKTRYVGGKDGYIFVNRKGEKLSTRAIQYIIKGLREKAGIESQIVPHSFRHSFGKKALEKNINIRHLQILLGHKSITSTQVYMNYSNNELKNAYNNMF